MVMVIRLLEQPTLLDEGLANAALPHRLASALITFHGLVGCNLVVLMSILSLILLLRVVVD